MNLTAKRVHRVKCAKLNAIDVLLASNPQWLPLWPEDSPINFSDVTKKMPDDFWLGNLKTPAFAIYTFIISQCEAQESGLMPLYKQKVRVIHSDRITMETARCRVGYFVWNDKASSLDGWINTMKRVFFEHQRSAQWIVDSFPRVIPQGYTFKMGDVLLPEIMPPNAWERRDFRAIVYKICLDHRFPDFHEAFLF